MTAASGAVFVDLDRTLLRSASGPVFHEAMEAEGCFSDGRHLPGDGCSTGSTTSSGSRCPSWRWPGPPPRFMRGRPVDATRRAGKRAVEPLVELVQPFALAVLAEHREAGRPLVLATTSPVDLVSPARRHARVRRRRRHPLRASGTGRYTGRLEGDFVWGVGKLGRRGSVGGRPPGSTSAPVPCLLRQRLRPAAAARRRPSPPRERRPPAARGGPGPRGGRSSTGTGPRASPRWSGSSPTTWCARSSGPRRSPTPASTSTGVEHIPRPGPVLLASNHRSYFDVAALGLVAARLGRPVRFLAKQEVFDAPVVGRLARALGGIPVERDQRPPVGRADAPGGRRPASRRGGHRAAPGHHPAGTDFFDPVLHGHTGTARLAARHGCPGGPHRAVGDRAGLAAVVQGARHDHAAASAPEVRVDGGSRRCALGLADAVADTEAIMAAISDLLPAEARVARIPTAEELARTPTAQRDRHRPPAPPRACRAARRRGGGGGQGRPTGCRARLGRGSGTVAGGRVGLALDPALLATLAQGRPVALVTGTNGKTTTTRLLVAALGPTIRAIASPPTTPGPTCRPGTCALVGSPAGAAARCSRSTRATSAGSSSETRPRVVALLNLSRDQLDRITEVRMLADRWRTALGLDRGRDRRRTAGGGGQRR